MEKKNNKKNPDTSPSSYIITGRFQEAILDNFEVRKTVWK